MGYKYSRKNQPCPPMQGNPNINNNSDEFIGIAMAILAVITSIIALITNALQLKYIFNICLSIAGIFWLFAIIRGIMWIHNKFRKRNSGNKAVQVLNIPQDSINTLKCSTTILSTEAESERFFNAEKSDVDARIAADTSQQERRIAISEAEANIQEAKKHFIEAQNSENSGVIDCIQSLEKEKADIHSNGNVDKNIKQEPVATTDTNSPIRYIVSHYYYTKVVGVTFNGIQSILPQLHEGMPVQFIREPNNPFDRNAIGIWCNGKKIGHLSADEAISIAPQMDKGIPYDGEISQITGGKGKTYGCEISVNVYKPSISGLTSQVEHIDESNPMFKKTCVLFGYDNFAAYNVAQSIANLGGFTRQRISGKTDFAIVNKEQPGNELEYTLAKVESYRAEGKKVEIMYSDKLEEIKNTYLNS